MDSHKLKSNPIQKLAARVLLAMVVFQLGACPCGCLEHNAWFQMMGLIEHHHDADAMSDGIYVQQTDHHDCTGEQANDYVDNSRHKSAESRSLKCLAIEGVQSKVLRQDFALSSHSLPESDMFPRECWPARSMLQVYQL